MKSETSRFSASPYPCPPLPNFKVGVCPILEIDHKAVKFGNHQVTFLMVLRASLDWFR
jgi:hypothetical protein